MSHWDYLPDDVVRLILEWRRFIMYPHYSAIIIQSMWRCYRVRVLIGRFRMLRYLHDFRVWNPSARTFLNRARI